MELVGKTFDEMIVLMEERYGKGRFHGAGLFRRIFQEGRMELAESAAFRQNPGLAARVEADFPWRLPEVEQVVREETRAESEEPGAGTGTSGKAPTVKFLLRMADGEGIEAVIIPMEGYNTLCVSCQAGCGRGCLFCETGGGGLRRQLSAAEIVSQLMAARFVLGYSVAKIVFMGMGEPLDNLDNIIQAIDIMADERGLNLPRSAMTLSTVGVVPGIRRLAKLASRTDGRYYHTLRLAVSLHAPTDELRSRLMPVNRSYPLAQLFSALKEFPLPPRGRVFFEYCLIPGINDSPEHARQLIGLLREHGDLPSSVNLITYNPTEAGRRNLALAADQAAIDRHGAPDGQGAPDGHGAPERQAVPPAAAPEAPRRGSGAKAFRHPAVTPEETALQAFFHTLLEAGIPVRIRHSRGADSAAACGQLAGRPRAGA